MQENKLTILSTRPLTAAAIQDAAARGVAVDTLSFIHTEPLLNEEIASQVKNLSKHPATVIFTSMNAVEAVTNCLNGQSPIADNSIAIGWKIFCIGNTTRQLLSQHFGAAAIAGTAASAAELAVSVINTGTPDEVIFFCGDQRRDELPGKLKDHGVHVKEIVTYKTIQTPVRVEKEYNGILFFSPSAVHSFFTVNTIPASTVLFAIGQTTAGAIKDYTNNTIITGDEPGKEYLLEIAVNYLKNRE